MSRVFHIGTRTSWRRVSILFDYDNPDHHDSTVLAYRVKKRTFRINLTPDMVKDVHKQANCWINDPPPKKGIQTLNMYRSRYTMSCCSYALSFLTSLKLVPDPKLSNPDDLNNLKPTSATARPPPTADPKSPEPSVKDEEEEE